MRYCLIFILFIVVSCEKTSQQDEVINNEKKLLVAHDSYCSSIGVESGKVYSIKQWSSPYQKRLGVYNKTNDNFYSISNYNGEQRFFISDYDNLIEESEYYTYANTESISFADDEVVILDIFATSNDGLKLFYIFENEAHIGEFDENTGLFISDFTTPYYCDNSSYCFYFYNTLDNHLYCFGIGGLDVNKFMLFFKISLDNMTSTEVYQEYGFINGKFSVGIGDDNIFENGVNNIIYFLTDENSTEFDDTRLYKFDMNTYTLEEVFRFDYAPHAVYYQNSTNLLFTYKEPRFLKIYNFNNDEIISRVLKDNEGETATVFGGEIFIVD